MIFYIFIKVFNYNIVIINLKFIWLCLTEAGLVYKNAKDVRLLCSTSSYIRYRQTPFRSNLKNTSPHVRCGYIWADNSVSAAIRCRRWASFTVRSAEYILIGDFDIPNDWQNAFGVIRDPVWPLSDSGWNPCPSSKCEITTFFVKDAPFPTTIFYVLQHIRSLATLSKFFRCKFISLFCHMAAGILVFYGRSSLLPSHFL